MIELTHEGKKNLERMTSKYIDFIVDMYDDRTVPLDYKLILLAHQVELVDFYKHYLDKEY